MSTQMHPHFVYLSWEQTKANQYLEFRGDAKDTVEVSTSIGPYKNNYAEFVMEKGGPYYWEIKIIKGNHMKIGILKESEIGNVAKKAFSDLPEGYSYYSGGELRNGSNKTGEKFGRPYGPGDIISVEFSPKNGTLSFGLNSEPLEKAFTVQAFKTQAYVPAIGTLIEGTSYSLTLPELED